MVTRLSGGLTPADGADPITFPAIWNATATDIETAESDIDSLQLSVNANGTAIVALQGSAVALGSAVDVIEAWDLDDLNDVTIGTAVSDGQVLAYSTAVSGWVNADAGGGGVDSYRFVETIYFTSNGTFTKATYPWLKALRVKCQGAGGGGGGVAAAGVANSAVSGGGGGGAYGEKFITDISGLDASITVTVGASGSGGAAGNNAGAAGGTSSFGSAVSTNGGGAGPGGAAGVGDRFTANGAGSNTASGVDLKVGGSGGSFNASTPTSGRVENGGNAFLGNPGNGISILSGGQNAGGAVARGYGAGGCGAIDIASNVARAGSSGAAGIVIVELYA
jgi:hypothetical protein